MVVEGRSVAAPPSPCRRTANALCQAWPVDRLSPFTAVTEHCSRAPPGGVEEGAVVFIPADVPHGALNTGNEPVRIFAVYPSTTVGLRYLERDPAPGTEADQPQPPVTLDLRTGEVATTP